MVCIVSYADKQEEQRHAACMNNLIQELCFWLFEWIWFFDMCLYVEPNLHAGAKTRRVIITTGREVTFPALPA